MDNEALGGSRLSCFSMLSSRQRATLELMRAHGGDLCALLNQTSSTCLSIDWPKSISIGGTPGCQYASTTELG